MTTENADHHEQCPAVLAEVTRGGLVESVHHGVIAVVDVAGNLVASVGDPERFAYFRSSAKPIQAIPLVASGAADAFGLTPAELALCCASHNGSPHHQTSVAALLAKIGLEPEHLQCGMSRPGDRGEAARVAAGLVPRSPLQCDCSGKHSGMLATCLHLGYPIETYLQPDHPLQREIRSVMGQLLRLPSEGIGMATDGCSLPTFGASIRTFATAYATFAAPDQVPAESGGEYADALNRLRAAMIAHPENVSGKGELVTDLMALGAGRLAVKSGAEGLICLAVPEHRLGIAIRVLDGSFRAHAVVVAAVLSQLELIDAATIDAVMARHDPVMRNHNGWPVGELRAAFEMRADLGATR